MIHRLVKMVFRPDEVESFLKMFHEKKMNIRNQPGCSHLQLWQDKRFSNVLFTFSIWENEEALERYRTSTLFKETWKETKAKFASAPEAWSTVPLVKIN